MRRPYRLEQFFGLRWLQNRGGIGLLGQILRKLLGGGEAFLWRLAQRTKDGLLYSFGNSGFQRARCRGNVAHLL